MKKYVESVPPDTVMLLTVVDVPPAACVLVNVTSAVPVADPVGSVIVCGFGEIKTVARVETPVPLSVTDAGVTVAPVYATVSVPLNDVADVGLNATFMVQEAPAASVPPQLGAPAGKRPVMTRENGCGMPLPNVNVPPANAVFPVLVTVSSIGADVAPVNQLPKARDAGDTLTVNVAAEPVPLSDTGEPLTVTFAVMVSVPANDPAAVGANTTLIVQVEAAFKVAPHVPPAIPAGRENGGVGVIVMPLRLAVPTLCKTSC